MVLLTKLWYNTEHYGTSINERKKHGRLPKTKQLWFTMQKTMVVYQNNWSFWTNLYLQNFDLLWKNYGTMEKSMVL